MRDWYQTSRTFLLESWDIYWTLIKVMVPIMIAVRVAQQYGAIDLIAAQLAPFMDIVGLPGAMGVVLVTGMFINIYASATALVTLLPSTPLTGAEMTVLTTMILIAHSLPVEQRIAQIAGPSFIFTFCLRLVGAILLGWGLHHFYQAFDMLTYNVTIDWLPATATDATWIDWTYDSIISLITIYVILIALLLLLKLMDIIGLTNFLIRLLTPFLKIIGLTQAAAPLTMAGLLLGLSYGGALIIKEVRQGTLSRQDIFLSICFLCLCHSMIEDTLFMIALGGHYSGVIIARLIFAIIITALLAFGLKYLSPDIFQRYLCPKARL